MAKLVVLNAGLTGRSCELKPGKITIGRVEDNTFQLAEASVSSHHCEILVSDSEIAVKDLGSTNGSFINGEKIIEAVLKPGQTLRLGQVELSLDTGGKPAAPQSAAAPAPAAAPGAASSAPRAPAAPAAAAPSGKKLEQTMVMQRGVSLNELEAGPRTSPFDTASKAFSKKSNQTNKWFLIGGSIVIVAIVLIILIAFSQIKK